MTTEVPVKPAPSKWRRWPVISAGTVGLVALVVVVAALTGGDDGGKAKAALVAETAKVHERDARISGLTAELSAPAQAVRYFNPLASLLTCPMTTDARLILQDSPNNPTEKNEQILFAAAGQVAALLGQGQREESLAIWSELRPDQAGALQFTPVIGGPIVPGKAALVNCSQSIAQANGKIPTFGGK